jgi:hypothetical protein
MYCSSNAYLGGLHWNAATAVPDIVKSTRNMSRPSVVYWIYARRSRSGQMDLGREMAIEYRTYGLETLAAVTKGCWTWRLEKWTSICIYLAVCGRPSLGRKRLRWEVEGRERNEEANRAIVYYWTVFPLMITNGHSDWPVAEIHSRKEVHTLIPESFLNAVRVVALRRTRPFCYTIAYSTTPMSSQRNDLYVSRPSRGTLAPDMKGRGYSL